MKPLQYKGEHYLVDNPRYIGDGKYTCVAKKERTCKMVSSAIILDGLAKKILEEKSRGKVKA